MPWSFSNWGNNPWNWDIKVRQRPGTLGSSMCISLFLLSHWDPRSCFNKHQNRLYQNLFLFVLLGSFVCLLSMFLKFSSWCNAFSATSYPQWQYKRLASGFCRVFYLIYIFMDVNYYMMLRTIQRRIVFIQNSYYIWISKVMWIFSML